LENVGCQESEITLPLKLKRLTKKETAKVYKNSSPFRLID